MLIAHTTQYSLGFALQLFETVIVPFLNRPAPYKSSLDKNKLLNQIY